MLAIQFQTTKQPVVRDTRDTWELREDLKKEQELQAQLVKEIRKYEEKLEKYETERMQSKELVLKETLEELRKKAGLTEVAGPGIIITVEQLFNESFIGSQVKSVPPEILKRLLNELNSFGAEEISIAGQRMITTSVIRDINGVTKINGYRVPSVPFEIKVIAKEAEKLYNRMKVANSNDDFAIENFKLVISTPINRITLPAYEDPIRIKYMEPIKADKEGE